jgi:hypothetical protein
VCLLPGTEIAFNKKVMTRAAFGVEPREVNSQVARFRQINKENLCTHHDALEFGEGEFVLLTHLNEMLASVWPG